jgi:UDP-N-acetylmuramoyl-tripeptide--D-alanyl-D-alanine ligase
MIPFDVAVQATQATVIAGDALPRALRVVTDTRTIEPGDTFLALRGDRFDGHDYVHDAVGKGAIALIVDDPSARVDGVTTLVVRDTLQAYMALAHAAREQFRGQVIAITGSAGKTTTRSFTEQLLTQRYGERVLASPANENNEIGVSKLLLAASNGGYDALVVEMGARHFGDIATLVAVAEPHVGILTNVGEAHLEIMGSRERLEATKWALFERGARAVLNATDATALARHTSLDTVPHWFAATGTRNETVTVSGRVTGVIGREWLYDDNGAARAERSVDIRVPGAHNRANLAAAAAGALELGVDFDAIAQAIPALQLPAGRYESLELPGKFRIIYDAYNANASGTIAALDAFAEEAAQRRIAVLASMAELGDEASELHERVGAHAASTKIDILLVGGEYASELVRGAERAGFSPERIVRFASNTDAAQWLREHADVGDVVLLKGSRKYKLEEVVQELMS